MSDSKLTDVMGRRITFTDVRVRVRGYGVESQPVREFAWLAQYEQALAAAERDQYEQALAAAERDQYEQALAAAERDRDEARAAEFAAEAPLDDVVLRHHAAMSQVEAERDEARAKVDGLRSRMHAMDAERAATREELAALTDRITTIADEKTGPHPVQSVDESLTCIERALADAHRRAEHWRAEVESARELLGEARAALALCTTRTFAAPEDAEVRALGERIGFGALMSAASKGWADVLRERHPEAVGGQHTAGPCEVTVQRMLAKLDAYLEERK